MIEAWGIILVCGFCLYKAIKSKSIENPGSGARPLKKQDWPTIYWAYVLFFGSSILLALFFIFRG